MASPGQCRRRRGLAEFAARLRGRVRVGLPIAVKQCLTCGGADIESISHKGLRRFFETGNAKGLVGDVNRLRKMLAFVHAAANFDELAVPPNYGLHELVRCPSLDCRRQSARCYKKNEKIVVLCCALSWREGQCHQATASALLGAIAVLTVDADAGAVVRRADEFDAGGFEMFAKMPQMTLAGFGYTRCRLVTL